MKKLLTIIALAAIGAATAQAQNTFSKGTHVLDLGIGIGNTIGSGNGFSSSVPPLSVAYEVGVVDNLFNSSEWSLGVGGLVGYESAKWGDVKATNLVYGIRGAAHWQLADKLDTYVGLMLGYNSVSYSDSNYNGSAGTTILPLFIGARYYIKDNFALRAELGSDIAALTVGVAFKF